MGFTQRQAAGKFTRAEAEAFIEQLEATAEGSDAAPAAESAAARPRPTAADRALHDVPAPRLAAELQRRGWIVVEP